MTTGSEFDPQPRFNEGWIDFRDGGAKAIKGSLSAEEVIASLVNGAAA